MFLAYNKENNAHTCAKSMVKNFIAGKNLANNCAADDVSAELASKCFAFTLFITI